MQESYPHFANELLAEPLSAHTTFHIGGPADVFVAPETVRDLVASVFACRDAGVDYFVLGKGSDLLVSDEGYRGVIVSLDGLTGIEREGDTLVCQAGAALKDVAERACEEGLAGFEFASGIPGSIGGACFMNAGAYDGCMADVLESVEVLTEGGDVVCLGVEDLDLGYRASRIRTERMIVLSARPRLTPGDSVAIRAKMDDLTARREEKQPLEYGSAGSTFKRPEGYFAGKLIMDAGLKGYQVGAAAVSTKHAGFVVNLGGATASDVRAVISHVQDEVFGMFGVRLEPEVRFLGFDE
jgi:UDP-N-acetylmuramate dehydrogenase